MTTATITARGRGITVVRTGDHITLTPRHRLNPFARPVRLHITRDLRYLAVHEPRGLRRVGWIEFGLAIDIADAKRAQHAVSRVEYPRARRHEFAALVAAGGWPHLLID